MHVPKMPFAMISKVFTHVNVKMVSLVMVLSVTKTHVITAVKHPVTPMVTANVQKVTSTRTRNALTSMNATQPIHHAKQTAHASTPMDHSFVHVTSAIFSNEDQTFVSTLTNVHLEHTNVTKMPNVATIQVVTTALARKASEVTDSTVLILTSVN